MTLNDIEVTKEDLDEIDNYFSLTKELSKDEHQRWKLIRKALQVPYSNRIEPTSEEIWAGIVISTVKPPELVMQMLAIKNRAFIGT